jgi:hypothetical protein
VGKKDDEKLLAELKKARKEAEEAEPVRRAGKSEVVKEAFDQKHGKGSKNGKS